MKFSAAGPARSYGKGPLYGNTFARAKASAHGKGGGGAPWVCASKSLTSKEASAQAAKVRGERWRTADFGFGISAGGGKVGKLGRLHSTESAVFAKFAAQNRKCIGGQGLTDFGTVAKRSVSFRNFPKLSVSFRFVPLCSVWFRVVPNGFPIAWCRAGSAECGVLSAAGTLGTHFPSSLAWLAAQNG